MHTDDHANNAMEQLLGEILRRKHRVLILLPPTCADSIRGIADVVVKCGCVPIIAQADDPWKSLLRLAFVERAETVIGTSQLILGLIKVAKTTNTPLFLHDVVLCDPAKSWLCEDLKRSLDCRIWNAEEQVRTALRMNIYTTQLHKDLVDLLLPCPNVLDFSASVTECGTSLEVVLLDNQKVSGLPNCAKLLIRKWNPENDVPFSAKTQLNG